MKSNRKSKRKNRKSVKSKYRGPRWPRAEGKVITVPLDMKAYDQKRRNREEFLQYLTTYHRDHPFVGHQGGCTAEKGFTWSSGYSEWVEVIPGKVEYYPIKQVHCKQCKRAFYIEPTGWRPLLEKLVTVAEPKRSSRPGRKRRQYVGLRPTEDLVVDWADTVPLYHQLINSGQMVLALVQEEADAPFSHLHRPRCSTRRGFYCASSSYEPYAIDHQRVALRIRVIRCRECRQSFRLIPAAWSRLEPITTWGKPTSSVSLPLTDTVEAYEQLIFQDDEFLKRISELKEQGWFPSHGEGCQAPGGFWLCGSYTRYPILPSGRKEVGIRRIRCCACKKTLSVLPTFVMPYKHFGTFIIANSLENWLIRNNTARDTLSITNAWLQDYSIRSQSTLYGWLKGLGQMKLTSLALQLGLKAPEFLSPDEKFLKQSKMRSYVLAAVEPKTSFIWHIDYLFRTEALSLEPSVRDFKDQLAEAAPPKGITVDGWEASHQAWQSVFPGLVLARCILHLMKSVYRKLPSWRKQGSFSEQQAETLAQQCWEVLSQSQDEVDLKERLNQLCQVFAVQGVVEWADRIWQIRSHLLASVQHNGLPRTTVAIDQVFKKLERKSSSMYTQRSEQTAKAWLTAWAMVYNFKPFSSGSKRKYLCPAELAGLNLHGLSWLEYLACRLNYKFV